MLLALVICFLEAYCLLQLPNYIGKLTSELQNINSISIDKNSIFKDMGFLLAYIIVFIILGLCSSLLFNTISVNYEKNLKKETFIKVSQFGYIESFKFSFDTLITRMTYDTQQVVTFITNTFNAIFMCFCMVLMGILAALGLVPGINIAASFSMNTAMYVSIGIILLVTIIGGIF
jgi:ABC-type multidrug transport system fused ATPase/permease subunit